MSRKAYDATNDTLTPIAGLGAIDIGLSPTSENPVQNKVITGELNKTYKDNDTAETDIADGDYFPFYDTSAEEKKKTLWSTITDKLKTILLPKTGGTLEGAITFSKDNKNAIRYAGTKATYPMIKFVDNTADEYGNGISIGGGGLTVIGGGESSDTLINGLNLVGATESLYLTNDGAVTVVTNLQNGVAGRKTFTFGEDGSLTVPGDVKNEDGYVLAETYQGTWTPQIYDNNTFKRNLASSTYYRVGNIIMAYYAAYNPDLSGISTMLQIRNFPGKVMGGQMYIAADSAGGAQLTVQGSLSNAVYFRPNWVSSRISSPTSPGNVTALIWGIV